MGKGQTGNRFRDLRVLFNAGTVSGLTDGQLLEHFTAQRGDSAELAFATLVERHGPMVLRVCRSLLRDPHEAHDAFQATFLVLVRRSGSLWVRDSLGPWLHQVAYRVASNARSASARRRRHERRAAELADTVGSLDEGRDPLGMEDVLHEEVNRLPGGYRSALILCYFEGLSPEQAAQTLGCPVGTVQSRLARGRAKLRTRLTRRGLAPALVALGAGVAEATPIAVPASLVATTVRGASALSMASGAGVISGSVIQLTQGALKSMFLIKLRTVALSIVAVGALAAGAATMGMFQDAPLRKDVGQIRAELGLPAEDKNADREPNQEAGPPPDNLTWTEVPAADRLRVLEFLAAQTKENHEKIKRWRGTYSFIARELRNSGFVANAGALKFEPLMQEFDRVMKFAIDLDSNSSFRDVETRRMRFLKLGTDEEVKIPNVGAWDHRWILTSDRLVDFSPTQRGRLAVLPSYFDASDKRRAERFSPSEFRARGIDGELDPRSFLRFDQVNTFWKPFEVYSQLITRLLGGLELRVDQADGPGGRWYRDRMGFKIALQPQILMTTIWNPLAGYNPVSRVTTVANPDEKIQSKIEWGWKRYDRVYLPSMFKESYHQADNGQVSREQVAKLTDCVVNRPLGLHQFDEQALGMADGDLVLDHPKKVVYIIRGGEPVKLANFGEGSILKPAQPKPAPAPSPAPTPKPAAEAASKPTPKPDPKPTGQIYTTASLSTDDRGIPVHSLIAVDPESGEFKKIFDGHPGRFRIAPDRNRVAFTSVEWWSNLPPAERSTDCLWIQKLSQESKPERVIKLNIMNSGGMPIWSADGKRMILSLGTHDDVRKQWVHETIRVNVDGSGKETLKLPAEDTVQDWSPDGNWVITASSRNAKIGWQLYIMKLDGTERRQITEGGNPFFARFSPDGKRLLYTDGPWKMTERRGIWVVDFDGKNARRILETGKGTASACWSPNGKRIAVAIEGAEPTDRGRLDIVEVDGGKKRTLLTMPGREIADSPEWR